MQNDLNFYKPYSDVFMFNFPVELWMKPELNDDLTKQTEHSTVKNYGGSLAGFLELVNWLERRLFLKTYNGLKFKNYCSNIQIFQGVVYKTSGQKSVVTIT